MLFKTDTVAEEIAAKLVELAKGAISEGAKQAAIGTALTEIFCRAMLQVFPKPSLTGKDILDVIVECNAIGIFPDPRRNRIRAMADMGVEDDNPVTN